MKSRFLSLRAFVPFAAFAAFAGLLGTVSWAGGGGSGWAPPFPPKALGVPAIAPNKLSSAQALAELQAENDRYWLNAQRIVRKSVTELIAQHQTENERGLRFAKIFRGDPDKKQIALTFDDGPHPQYTPQILAILYRYKVPATFFVVGEQAERYPDLIRAEIAGGHNVGNHTYHHVSLPKIPPAEAATEIKACGEVLRAITGRAPHLFRPPGGEYDRDVAEAAQRLGYVMALWTDDPGDYASPGQNVVLSRTLAKASPGGIILIHDGIAQTIAVLPRLIASLQKQGYAFVTVDQMLADAAGHRRGTRSLTRAVAASLHEGAAAPAADR